MLMQRAFFFRLIRTIQASPVNIKGNIGEIRAAVNSTMQRQFFTETGLHDLEEARNWSNTNDL